MNENHIQQIFANYIEQFEQMNNTSHQEYYKWKIINRFHDEMDNALNVPAVEFPKKLYELKKLSFNLIDNYTQPFYGLVKFAEKEPDTVRDMFRDLYSEGDLQKRVQKFLTQSHSLREKYYPNSYLYIFLFLPITVLMYGLAHRIRPLYGKLVLIIAGTVFYTCGRLETAYALLLSTALTYICALLLKKRSLKQLLYVPVIVNVAILFWFKYTGFFLSILGSQTTWQILLPVGISFYTFQQIAYLVSVDRKQIEPALLDYLAYILYFPKLLMGPLAEPANLISQFNDPERKAFVSEAFAEGVRLFSYGLMKKVILADTFARAIALINADLSTATAAECLLMMVF